jgi:hypothetical protein
MSTTTQPCRARADWYLDRIDDLLRAMGGPARTGDDVELCQAMLRELLARFRADQRPLPEGRVGSASECRYVAAIADAAGLLRLSSSSRPTGRWREGLNACRDRIQRYVVGLSVPNHEMLPR